MSSVYIERLRKVRGEFQAAQQSLRFVLKSWDRLNLYNDVEGVSPADISRAGQLVEATYLLRLFAEFEGILENHLRANHPSVKVSKDRKVDWLIRQVLNAESLNMEHSLRDNINRLRQYRNDFIHTGNAPVVTFTFRNALSWLNTFLARLPDPLT